MQEREGEALLTNRKLRYHIHNIGGDVPEET